MSSYTLDINPREILLNNLGVDGFLGGGNLWGGQSAEELDDVIVHLKGYPRATIAIDISQTNYAQFATATIADVQQLRDNFFKLYGLGKQNWYGPPVDTSTDQQYEFIMTENESFLLTEDGKYLLGNEFN